MRDMDIVELASRVSPTRYLINASISIQVMQARIGVRLQSSGVVLEMLPRMFALAVCGISEPNGRSSGLCRGPIIANIGPETADLSPAVAGCKHRNRRVIAVDLQSSQNMLPDLIDQGRNQFAGCAHPAGKCGAIEIDALACKDLRLPVERLVICELRHQNMCQ